MGIPRLFCPETGRRGRLVLVVDHVSNMDSAYYFSTLHFQQGRLIPNGFQRWFDSAAGSKTTTLLAMTQEQFNFLEGFAAYLTRRGFRVCKSLYDAEAVGEAMVFDSICVACRFSWQWQGARSSVCLSLQVGTVILKRCFLTAVLMDHADDVEILTMMIRSVMREAADKIAMSLIQK